MRKDVHISGPGRGACPEQSTEALHRYLDGDLSVSEQPGVFEHLASCSDCRQMMDSIMAFRRMSRQEHIVLPPASDDTFFQRLAKLKQLSERIDRSSDRAPLWSARRSISLRSALALIVAVFLFGLMVPMPARTNYARPLIQLSVEKVDFSTSDSVVIETPIYVYYGLTVEAVRPPEISDTEQN